MPRVPTHRRSAVILTALDVETKAVLRHVKGQGGTRRNGTVFYQGKFESWDIAVAEVRAGNTSAAAIAERAIANFGASVALFVGVAGGIKDVKIGDVVIADKMYGYESGKDDELGFRARPEVKNAAHDIEQEGRALPKDDQWLKRLNGGLQHMKSVHPDRASQNFRSAVLASGACRLVDTQSWQLTEHMVDRQPTGPPSHDGERHSRPRDMDRPAVRHGKLDDAGHEEET
jgi:nucleoside phosphorylase